MWGNILGAGISGAFGLLGSAQNRRASAAANQQNVQFQKEFAKHGITWKKEDAERAGLHPLFALGGSGATFSPSVRAHHDTSLQNLGQNLGRGVRSAMDDRARALHNAGLEESSARVRKDKSIADYYASEAARNRQADRSIKPVTNQVYDLHGNPISGSTGRIMGTQSSLQGHLGDVITDGRYMKNVPEQPTSRVNNPGITASQDIPLFMQVRSPDGDTYLLPTSEEVSESIENSLNPFFWPELIRQNLIDPNIDNKYKRWFQRTNRRFNPIRRFRDKVKSNIRKFRENTFRR